VSAPWVAAFATLAIVTLLNTAVVLGGLRRIASVLERAEARASAEEPVFGAAVGSAVDPFDLVDESGETVAWRELVREPTILLLMSTSCAACAALAEHLEDVGEEVDGVPLVVVADDGAEARGERLPSGLRVLYQRDGAATRALGNRATPQAYVLDPSGVVLGRRVPATLDDLRDMAWLQRSGRDRARKLEATAHR
jgi:thiol-disulfide isomerase/thioredoxin